MLGKKLALCVRCVQVGVGGGPDTLAATTRSQEEGGRSQRHKSHQQRVLDQVLALFVSDKFREKEFHVCHLKMRLRCESWSHKYPIVRLWELILCRVVF